MKSIAADHESTFLRPIADLTRGIRHVVACAAFLLPGLIWAQSFLPVLPPIFTVQPSNQTVLGGQAATFTVLTAVFGGTGVATYQWQQLAAGSNTPVNLDESATFTGTQSSTLTVNNVTPAVSGVQFQCVARNGTLASLSSAAVLTVPTVNLVITSPAAVTANLGAPFTYTISASGIPTSFSAPGLPSGLTLNSATGLISGTPNLAGVSVVAISASNATGSGSASLVITVVGASPLPTYSFSTVAGIATLHSAIDGTGLAARFRSPAGITVDVSGNLFVADYGNNVIRKVTPAGVVTLYSGLPGVAGSIDNFLSYARYNGPIALAADGAGNVYVSDYGNNTIRKIGPPPTQTVTTLAGTAGTTGGTDGTGAAARFNGPNGLAIDSSGNLYVADYGNQTIRKVTPAGVVTTVAGSAGSAGSADGTGAAARFNGPNGLAIDSTGNLYVADLGNNTIRKVTPAGVVTTLAGAAGTLGSANGVGSAARFYGPIALAIDSTGNLLVPDLGNNTLRKITPAGVVTTVAGTAGVVGSADGSGVAAQFYSPVGVATDSANNVYVADFGNNTIRKVSPAGVVSTFAGSPVGASSADGVGAAAKFDAPEGMAVDGAGNIFVADVFNNEVRKITPAGVVTTLAGSSTNNGSANGVGAAARFNGLTSVAVDAAGNVYVADNGNHTIRKITSAGVVTTLCGAAGINGSADGTSAAARFYNPFGVAADSAGNLYVADAYNHTIRKVTPAGVVTTIAGSAGNDGRADGAGAVARFSFPAGIAVDSAGNIYVADFGNATLRKVTPGGVVTTLAGLAGAAGSADGIGAAARFNGLTGVAVDAAGNVYVADGYNNTVRKVTAGGIVTTIGGVSGAAGSVDGNGSAARFYAPNGIAVDAAGNIYVSDTNNCTIRKGLAPTSTTGRLLNLSVLTSLTPNETMTVGTVLGGGAATSTVPVLFRAAGPSLTQFGVGGILPNPAMTLNSTSGSPALFVASNSGWGGTSALVTAFTQVGAFAYSSSTSADSAIYRNPLSAGNYTVVVRDAGSASGNVIVEIYDATPFASFASAPTRLTNVSVLKNISTSLTAGFVVGGAGGKTVLLRAVGPTLGTAFGLPGVMSDPQLTLFSGQTAIASNDNWGTPTNSAAATAAQITTAAISVGAFTLGNGSKDATILITLLPGNYTAQVTGVGGSAGSAIVEVYEVP